MQKHPHANVQRLLDAAYDGTDKLCTAGNRGYYILLSGDYGSCAPMLRKFGKMGNIIADDAFRSLHGRQAVCPEFPPEHPDVYPSPVPELSCWCTHNTVDLQPGGTADEVLDARLREIAVSKPVVILWEMSRLCNFSCHYCLTADKVFNNRTSKTYVAGDGTPVSLPSLPELTGIADKIFRQFDRVDLMLIGPMEPLTNANMVGLMRHMLRYKDQVNTVTITTNLSLTQRLNEIVDMGWGHKLILYGSLHVLEDNFDPFAVVGVVQHALRNNVQVETHVVPSSEVMRFLSTYLEFFSIFGIKVNMTPLVMDFGDYSVFKYEYPADFQPKAFAAMKNFVARVCGDGATAEEQRFLDAALALNGRDMSVLEIRAGDKEGGETCAR